jgi:CxxC motif-containing protein
MRELRLSKKAKPYFICDPCGVQAFIRKETGVQRLKGILGPIQELPETIKSPNKVLESIKLIEELRGKYTEIENQEGITDLFITDESRELQKAALQAEIIRVEKRLKKHVKRN